MKVRRSLGMFVAAVMSLSLVAACDVPLPDDRDSAPRVSPSPTPEPTDTSAPPSPTPEEPTEESPEPEETPGETPSEGEPTPSPDPSDPTPTPTQDPSPSPTPTADPSPTPTPTPTPDPAPEPEPKPDPAPAPDSGSTDARGFTVIPTSSDTRKVYVSSSSGSDNNDCLSEAKPCKSIGEGVKKIRPGHADHLYLKAGDVWVNDNGLLALRGGRSLTEPTVITSYGEGARPRLEAHGSYRMLAFNTGGRIVNDLWFIGLHIQNSNLVAGHPTFTGEAKNSSMFLGGHSNILLEDNIFDHHEVIFQTWEGKNPTNIKVRRNIFTGAYTNTSSYSQNKRPSNMYLSGVNGLLLEENVFDSGGWHPTAKGAGANMYNHNIYVQYSQLGDTHVVRDNLFTRASSHGIQMRSGGLAENNFFGRNAIGLLLGYGTQKPLKDARIRAFDNVITEGHSMIKGHDHCQGNNLCTAALWGLDINIPADKKFEADRNIVHSRSKADDSASLDRYQRGLSAASLRIRDKSTDPSKTSIEGLKSIILWRWNNNSEDFGPGNYPDPGRTLGDYYEHLRSTGALDQIVKNGTVDKVRKDKDDFVSFLNLAMNRAPGEWDDRIAAPAVNDYIRAGFGW